MSLQRSVMVLWGFLCLAVAVPSHAAKVTKVDGKKVMLNLEGDTAKVGDIFVVYNPEGKKKALIKIKAIRGDRAAAFLGKGKAETGWTAKVSDKSKGGGTKTAGRSRRSQEAETSPAPSGETRSYWGAVVGFSMDSMSVDVDNSSPADGVADKTVSLSGSSFSAKGLFDYLVFPQIWFRGMTGLEGLAASGSAEVGCDGGKTCEVNIYYLSFDFWGRYVFTNGGFRPWLGAGFSLMFPMSKDATALEKSSITNTSAMSAGLGFDWFLSDTMYIPMQVEYSMLPKSETVEASAINIRAGLAWPF
jgi:outer membrane protein W